MGKKVNIIDTTLRDAQQSLWATRMSTASMLPIAEQMDRAGFQAIDFLAQVQIDVLVRFLKENPWERLRLFKQRVQRTPLRTWMRAKGYSFTDIMPDDLIELWIERLVANGLEDVVAFDGLNDFDNLAPIIRHTKRIGARSVCALTFSVSPVHSDDLYSSIAKRIADETPVDGFVIKDSGGLLTPDRIRTLVPAIKAMIGDRPLELHTHSPTGLGPLVLLEGIALGVDTIHTAIAPLANGVAHPSIQSMAANLRHLGHEVAVDDSRIQEISEHIKRVAEAEGKPLGQVLEYDSYHYEHQAPGGMITNFKASLAEAGLADRIDEVLDECVQVRKDIGWPMLITPFAQIIGTQALMNVLRGERYAVVPDVLKKYVLGYYGRLLAPVDPNALDKIVSRGSQQIPLTPQPPEPIVPALRKRYPGISDEERLLRHMFAGNQVDQMLAAPPIDEHYSFERPVIKLLRNLLQRQDLRYVCVQQGADKVELRR